MSASFAQGMPCWFELGTSDLDAAATFYGDLFGWTIEKSPMADLDYRLAAIGGDQVAGMMSTAAQTGGPPPNWLVYFAVDDCDRFARQLTDQGGKVFVPPTDVPRTGRFAVLADPQGVMFGVLTPMPGAESAGAAFDQQAAGHGNWVELMTPDPKAALTSYSTILGWKASRAMDMGEMGTYQLFSHQGQDIGGMMGQGRAMHRTPPGCPTSVSTT